MKMSASSSKKTEVDVDASNSVALACEYGGFKPEPGVTRLLDRVDATGLLPSTFFDEFIKLRRPVVVSGLLTSSTEEWNVQSWSDDYLIERAGSCNVHVEDWKETEISEGVIEIKYEDLIKNISAGDGRYNLSTVDSQVLSSDIDCDNALESTLVDPLTTLIDDFPCRPALFGNLVVRRIALCQGNSGIPVGISSGIKHDFHDRFCLLLRGRKRYRLFPPSAVNCFLVPGLPVKIYSNGLIVYLPKIGKKQRKPLVRADGAPFEAVVRQKRDDSDRNLMRAERKLYNLRRSGTSNRAELEKAMDLVNDCENVLDTANAELHRFDTDADSDDDDNDSNEVISIHDDDSDPELGEEPASKIRKVDGEENSALWDEEKTGEVEDWQSAMREMCLSVEDTDEPLQLFAQCPQLKDVPCLTVDLHPGELLYLPASWFYEVTTYDNSDLQPGNTQGSGKDGQRTDNASETCSALKTCNEQVSLGDNQNAGNTSEKCSDQKPESEQLSGRDNHVTDNDLEKCSDQKPENEQMSSGDNQVTDNIHEESSQNKPISETRTSNSVKLACDGRPGHLSLDYWTFPPDNDQFVKPYNDRFWPRRWNKFEKERTKVCRRSKLISSDVISLNSESSESSSSNDSSDEEEEELEEDVGCSNGNDAQAAIIGSMEQHVSRANSSAISIGDDQSSAVNSGAISVGDDSEIESDDAEDESYDYDSDVVDLDSSHQETHNNENTSSIVLDEDDSSHQEMVLNHAGASSIVLDEDDSSRQEILDDECTPSIVLDEDDVYAADVAGNKEPIAIDDDILDENKQTDLNDDDILDEELLNSSSDDESMQTTRGSLHTARQVGSKPDGEELVDCIEGQEEHIKVMSDETISGTGTPNASLQLIKSGLCCNVQVTNNSI